MSNSLITKYRPKTFAEVVGQPAVVRSMKQVLEKRSAHAFLFTGPSGTGKTTLARIAATLLGATTTEQLKDFDAATNTGIDDVRAIMDVLRYKPIGVKAIKVMVIDECHALSAPAWKAMLKSLEEPPSWCYWFLCTTDASRVPVTIRTRCNTYALQPVDKETLYEWLRAIADKEGLCDGEDGDRVVSLCVKEAYGSPRQALSNLSTCGAAETRKEAADLLRSADSVPEAVALARMLDQGGTWKQVQGLLEGLKEVNPESVRQVVRAYMTKAALGADSEKAWGHRLQVLDAFSEPCNSSDGVTPILLSVARAMFSR